MVDAGCDVIEVGLPYSDPVMDGPTIQAAAQAALEGGIRTTDVLRTVEAVAATGVPTVVMTYWNPVERYGVSGSPPTSQRRGSGPDHARPHPRLRPRVDRRGRRARPRQDLPRRAVVHRRADRDDHRGLPRLRLRHRGHGRDRRADHDQRPRRSAGRPHPAPTTDLPVGVVSGSAPATRPPRSAWYADGVIVGLGVRPGPARPPRDGLRAARADRAHRGAGRGGTPWVEGGRVPPSPLARACSSRGCAGPGEQRPERRAAGAELDPPFKVLGAPLIDTTGAPSRLATTPTSGSPWSSSATPTAPRSAAP